MPSNRLAVGAQAILGALICASVLSVAYAQHDVENVNEGIRDQTLIDGTTERSNHTKLLGIDISYRSSVGRLPIRDIATGRIRAFMSYVAYTAERQGHATRPLTFLWAGGPSAGAARADTGNFGPKEWHDGAWRDNPASLIDVSDLVFVDPVGTGFSRPTQEGFGPEFYTVKGDAASFAEFIRVWMAREEGPAPPIFLYGPSYGSWRAGAVTEDLAKAGIPIAGTFLISGGILVGPDVLTPLERAAWRVPAQAATALHYGRLDRSLGTSTDEATSRAKEWVQNTYLVALKRVDELTDVEREKIARELASHTGYPLDRIDRRVLAFSQPEYRQSMLGQGRRIDWLDMRETEANARPLEDVVGDQRRVEYIRTVLGYRTDLAYLGIETGYWPVTQPMLKDPGSQWVYDTGDGTPVKVVPLDEGVGPPVKGEPWIPRTIALMQSLKLFVGAGLYDSLNSCAGNEASLEAIGKPVASHYELHCYLNGHRMGVDAVIRNQLASDARTFIRRTASNRSSGS